MNKIVIAAILVLAAGCKKAPDCDAEIGKGMDSYLAQLKQRTQNPDALLVASKLREATIERCKADKWSPEAVRCYGTAKAPQEIQTCQEKLTEDQRNKLMAELREEMMSIAGRRMPQGMAGHPSALAGSGAGSGATAQPAQGAAAPAADGSAATPAPGSAAPAVDSTAPAAGSAAAPPAPAPAGSAAK